MGGQSPDGHGSILKLPNTYPWKGIPALSVGVLEMVTCFGNGPATGDEGLLGRQSWIY